MPENFNFDLGDGLGQDGGGGGGMEAAGGHGDLLHQHKAMTMISVPNSTQAFQIQVNFAHLFSGCPDP
jgi:hypothetical protein